MVKFGEKIERERFASWAPAYLDYDMLKRRLDAIIELDKPEWQQPNLERIREARKNIFEGCLDEELQKVLNFYQAKLVEIRKHVEEARPAVELAASQSISAELTGSEAPGAAAAAHKAAYAQLAARVAPLKRVTEEITQLLGFVSLNMAAVRKILKKYAKHVEPSKPMPGFLTLQIEHPHEPGWNMLQGTFLPASVAKDLESFQTHRDLMHLKDEVHGMFDRLRGTLAALHAQQAQHGGAAQRLASTASSGAAPRSPMRAERSLMRQSVDLSGQVTIDLEGALREMDEMELQAQRNAGLVHAVAWADVQAGIFEPPPADEFAIATTAGLLLNCINSGLYMANYNLVIPTITEFCHHIGVGNAVVGLVIGCCDFATIPGTTGYSIWTNYNYKWPLVASAIACLAGNLAYVLSYDRRLLWMLVLARLVTGLGSARAVNRRYIAMFVKKQDRTWASALFVSLSAVGMALGPLLALPLSHFPDLSIAGLTVNHITMGGWSMSAAWVIFILFTLFVFEDPLDKQKKLAAQRAQQDALREPLLGITNGTNGTNGNPSLDPNSGAANPAYGVVHPPSKALATKASAGQLAPGGEEQVVEYGEDGGTATFAQRWESFWDSSVPATIVCIFLCFILKVVQQAYIDGLPIFTEDLFGWSNANCGLLLAVLGLTAPLVNTAIGALSARISDRRITLGSILVTCAGCLGLMHGGYPLWLFFPAGVAVYMGTIVLEAVSMSLVSKVIDERMSKGLFNAGLLSTQAGTIGRLSGNLLLSAVAAVTGAMTAAEIARFSRLLFGLNALWMVLSVGTVVVVYRRLAC